LTISILSVDILAGVFRFRCVAVHVNPPHPVEGFDHRPTKSLLGCLRSPPAARETVEMSEGNVELQRRALEAFHARDVEAFIACLDASVEYHSVMTVPGGAVYHAHDGVRKYFEDFKDAWGDDFRVAPEAFFDLGEHTLMFYSVHGLGQHSGAEVAMRGAQVCRWRDGLMVYGKAYVHREDALRDLGVSEEELSRFTPKGKLDGSITCSKRREGMIVLNGPEESCLCDPRCRNARAAEARGLTRPRRDRNWDRPEQHVDRAQFHGK
jgi:ketosteroid isomerase-like protein